MLIKRTISIARTYLAFPSEPPGKPNYNCLHIRLYRLTPCNKYLWMINIRQSDCCSFCQETDSLFQPGEVVSQIPRRALPRHLPNTTPFRHHTRCFLQTVGWLTQPECKILYSEKKTFPWGRHFSSWISGWVIGTFVNRKKCGHYERPPEEIQQMEEIVLGVGGQLLKLSFQPGVCKDEVLQVFLIT